jgi:hypothetical protein
MFLDLEAAATEGSDEEDDEMDEEFMAGMYTRLCLALSTKTPYPVQRMPP